MCTYFILFEFFSISRDAAVSSREPTEATLALVPAGAVGSGHLTTGIRGRVGVEPRASAGVRTFVEPVVFEGTGKFTVFERLW